MLEINKNEQNGFHVFGKTMNNDDPWFPNNLLKIIISVHDIHKKEILRSVITTPHSSYLRVIITQRISKCIHMRKDMR